MKFYKVTLRQNPGGSLIYPDNYQQEIGNYAKDHLYYDDLDNPMLLLCISDKDANDIVRDYVEEISETDAKNISEDNETRTETIKDEAKIRRLEIKSRLGIGLTADEIGSLDPGNPDGAFGISEIFADRIEKLKEKESLKLARKDKEVA